MTVCNTCRARNESCAMIATQLTVCQGLIQLIWLVQCPTDTACYPAAPAICLFPVAPISPAGLNYQPASMKFSTPLAVLLLVACASAASAASRGRMLLSCEDDCKKGFEDNVSKCIAKTGLGKPPTPVNFGGMPIAQAAAPMAFVAPSKTAFQLTEDECRKLQTPEFHTCIAACKPAGPDCFEVAKKCRASFDEGTLLEAYCKKDKGC